MKEIPLTRGYVALVDDEDYEWLMQWKWQVQVRPTNKYAVCTRENKTTYMHRVIAERMGLKLTGLEVDHKDRNGLNNTRENLRAVSHSQNMRNQRHSNPARQYKGVYWSKFHSKWITTVMLNGSVAHLGLFDNEHYAAQVYNAAVRYYYEGVGYLNEVSDVHILSLAQIYEIEGTKISKWVKPLLQEFNPSRDELREVQLPLFPSSEEAAS